MYNCIIYVVILFIDLVPVTVLWAFSVFTYIEHIWQMLERQIHNSVRELNMVFRMDGGGRVYLSQGGRPVTIAAPCPANGG